MVRSVLIIRTQISSNGYDGAPVRITSFDEWSLVPLIVQCRLIHSLREQARSHIWNAFQVWEGLAREGAIRRNAYLILGQRISQSFVILSPKPLKASKHNPVRQKTTRNDEMQLTVIF